jgi:hypothetical protein
MVNTNNFFFSFSLSHTLLDSLKQKDLLKVVSNPI